MRYEAKRGKVNLGLKFTKVYSDVDIKHPSEEDLFFYFFYPMNIISINSAGDWMF